MREKSGSARENYEILVRYIKSGIYEIDEKGRVFRVIDRRSMTRMRRRLDHRMPNGYQMVSFRFGEKTLNCLVHRLVWMLHHGPVPEGFQINHIDGVKENNTISNLELVTPSENVLHAIYVTKKIKMLCSSNRNAKLTNRDFARIFWWRGHGMRVTEIASRLSTHTANVYKILGRKTWRVFI